MSKNPKDKADDAHTKKTHEKNPAVPRGNPASDQDLKKRFGNYGAAGEHPINQPGGKNGSNH